MRMNLPRLCILKDVLFMQVQACGSMVTEEQPHAMLIPMEFFLMGYTVCIGQVTSVTAQGALSVHLASLQNSFLQKAWV